MATTASEKDAPAHEGLTERDRKALEQYLTALDRIGRVRGADDLYLVVSESGSEYLVDMQQGACECPDFEYRGVKCKHARRIEFATGERPIPADADVDIDPQLGDHVDGTPRLAMPDGGIVVASDADHVDDGNAENANEDPCDCDDLDGDLDVCAHCYIGSYGGET